MAAYISGKISKKNTVAIVLAGGIGSRVNVQLPKQFLPIHKKPLLFYSIELFLKMRRLHIGDIIVVIPKGWLNYTIRIIERRWGKLAHFHVIAGGQTRIESYFKATKFIMDNLPDTSFVVINDVARPLANFRMVKRSLGLMKKSDIGLLISPLEESLFKVHNINKSEVIPLDRDRFFYGQTPYSFKFKVLVSIYRRFGKTSFSLHPTMDIISLAHKLGVFKINADRNLQPNLKITYPHDFLVVERLL